MEVYSNLKTFFSKTYVVNCCLYVQVFTIADPPCSHITSSRDVRVSWKFVSVCNFSPFFKDFFCFIKGFSTSTKLHQSCGIFEVPEFYFELFNTPESN